MEEPKDSRGSLQDNRKEQSQSGMETIDCGLELFVQAAGKNGWSQIKDGNLTGSSRSAPGRLGQATYTG